MDILRSDEIPGLELVASMEGHHTARQIEIFDALESDLLHQLFQFLLRRMHANRLDKIAVAVAILGNKAAHRGEQIERVGIIKALQRFQYFGKLQHNDTPARKQQKQHTLHATYHRTTNSNNRHHAY